MVDFRPFFSTVAQVTFTLAGLLLIALAGDNKSRRFWFGHEPRAIFAYISFTLVVMPGIFSIGSLVFTAPSSSDKIIILIPSWPFAAVLTGIFYWFLSGLISDSKNKIRDDPEFLRLDKILSVVHGIRTFAVLFIFLGLYGAIEYWTKPSSLELMIFEIVMGTFVSLVVLLGTIMAIQFFRHDADLKKSDTIESLSTLSENPLKETETQFLRFDSDLKKTVAIENPSTTPPKPSEEKVIKQLNGENKTFARSSLYKATALFSIVLAAFLSGIAISQWRRK